MHKPLAIPLLLISATVLLGPGLKTLASAPGKVHTPHVKSSWTLRVVNRRYVSHILHERRARKNYVTLLVTHGPNYHAFHSRLHALYKHCGSYRTCFLLLRRLDRHLRAGHNLGLEVHGSQVRRILFYKKKR